MRGERDLSLRSSGNSPHARHSNTQHTQYRSLVHDSVRNLVLADPHLSQSTVKYLVGRRGVGRRLHGGALTRLFGLRVLDNRLRERQDQEQHGEAAEEEK